uniref:Uncharacterized protein n=1 Tax=Oryza punctata TaxID=4537 RepID=A0A0E0LAZ2_ORYPU
MDDALELYVNRSKKNKPFILLERDSQVRSRPMHNRLKHDLVEHIWARYDPIPGQTRLLEEKVKPVMQVEL